MKKILALLLSVLMLMFVLPFGISVVATDVAIIMVGSYIAAPGNTVNIDISIENNPGIFAMAFCVTYDNSAFEYVDYTQGYLTNYTITNHEDKGIVSFVNVEESNVNTNGTLLTLNFKVKTTAENGDYVFEIKNNNPDKYDTNLHNSFANSSEQFVAVTAISGTVTVVDNYFIQQGDVNCDGIIDNIDFALLMQYINNWDVKINTDVSDLNNDGNIDNVDFALLMQYINGWNVKLI